MTLTCLSCGTHRGKEEAMAMNARVRRACEGKCRGETVHIAGLPREYVHLTTVEVLSVAFGKRVIERARREKALV